VAEDLRRDIDEFARALVEMGVAADDELEGCTEEEMAAVLENGGGFPLPGHYLAFLRRLGRQAGRLLRGTDFYYPEPLEANAYAKEFVEGDSNLRITGRFFFATHQGYQLYFFDETEPEKVYLHTEGTPEPQLLEETFLGFLWQTARGEAISSTAGLGDE
jgi:hypothetical protein